MSEQVEGLNDRVKALEERPKLQIAESCPGKQRVKMLVSHIAVLTGQDMQTVYQTAYRSLEQVVNVELMPRKKRRRARSILEMVDSEGWLPFLVEILEEMAGGVGR
jgi:hypothetical protein